MGLCALAPSTVGQADLDARAVNAPPATGVALAPALGIAAYRRGGLGVAGSSRRDGLRLVLSAALLAASVPWLFAELGALRGRTPFLADEPAPPAGEPSPDESPAAVHLGSHEGMDGVLCALAALGLSRQLARFHAARLARGTAAALSPLLAYGGATASVDGWNEQVWKRGSLGVRLPGVVLPSLSWGRASILALAVLVFVPWFGREAA